MCVELNLIKYKSLNIRGQFYNGQKQKNTTVWDAASSTGECKQSSDFHHRPPAPSVDQYRNYQVTADSLIHSKICFKSCNSFYSKLNIFAYNFKANIIIYIIFWSWFQLMFCSSQITYGHAWYFYIQPGMGPQGGAWGGAHPKMKIYGGAWEGRVYVTKV